MLLTSESQSVSGQCSRIVSSDYDAMGNRTSATIASQGGNTFNYGSATTANQYTSITGRSAITHDANGNQLLNGAGAACTWNSENRLLTVTPVSPNLGDKAHVHGYDGLHRRVTRTTREWTSSGWTNLETTYFIYDGWNVIEEWASTFSPATAATLTRRLTWGQDLAGSPSLQGAGGVGGLLMVEEITSTTNEAYHFHYDGNGNVTEITDHLGVSVATYRYDAFGNTLVATGTYATTNRYRFSTKPLDHEVTTAPLYYYGYRYLDPVTGRWSSRDPIEERGGVNLYGFVGNDGVGWIDLFGEMAFRDLDHWVKAKYESEDEDFLFVRLHVKGGCLDWGYGYCSGKVDIFLTVTMWVRNKGRKSDPDTKAIMTGSSNGPWLSFGKASHSFGAHVVTGGGWSKTTTVKVGQADCCGGYYKGDFDVSAARVGSAPSVFYKGNWNLLIKKCGDVANIDVNLWNNYSLAATHPRGFGPATFRIGAPISKDRGTGLDP